MNILPRNLTRIAIVPVNTKLHAQSIAWYSPFCEVCDGYAPANLAVFVGYNPGADQMARMYRDKGTPTVLWWIGTDVLMYTSMPPKDRPEVKDLYNYHMCPSEANKAELTGCGIDAIVQSVVPAYTYPTLELELDKKRVMIYFPVGRYEESFTWEEIKPKLENNLYCLKEMMEICEACPEVEFYIYGNGCEITQAPTNVTIVNRVDQNLMHNLYSRCNILIRKTTHEGYSQSVIEAKQCGLQVITNHKEAKHVIYADMKDEFIKKLKEIEVKVDDEGSKYYQEVFNPLKVMEKWKAFLDMKDAKGIEAENSAYYRGMGGLL